MAERDRLPQFPASFETEPLTIEGLRRYATTLYSQNREGVNMTTAVAERVGAQVVSLTPEKAREWLATRNGGNRRLRKTVVARYARDMLTDHWQLTGQPIIFDEGGHLIDGQHRLSASLQSGKGFTALVVSGVPHGSYEALDQGVRRTLADALMSRGFKQQHNLAAAIRISWKWEVAGLGTQFTPSIGEALDYFEKNPGLVESVRAVNSVMTKPLRFVVSASAPFHYKVKELWPEETDRFFHSLSSGADLREGSGEWALRRWLLGAATSRGYMETATYIASAIKAFNAFVTGRSINRVSWMAGRGEPFPELVSPIPENGTTK